MITICSHPDTKKSELGELDEYKIQKRVKLGVKRELVVGVTGEFKLLISKKKRLIAEYAHSPLLSWLKRTRKCA